LASIGGGGGASSGLKAGWGMTVGKKHVGFEKTPFTEVLSLLKATRNHTAPAANPVLIDLYWKAGEPLRRQVIQAN
jgi:hypothetical protein